MTHLPRALKQNTTTPRPCVFQVVRVSGTIRKSEEEAIRRARGAILRAKKKDEDEGEMMGLQAILRGTGEDESLGLMGKGGRLGIEDEDDDEDEEEHVDSADG